MNIAILTISSLSLVASAGTLYLMYKTRKGLVEFGADLRSDVDNVKATTNQTIGNLRTALDGIEL